MLIDKHKIHQLKKLPRIGQTITGNTIQTNIVTDKITVTPSSPRNFNSLQAAGYIALNAASSVIGASPDNFARLTNGISGLLNYDSVYNTTPFWGISKLPIAMLDFRSPTAKIAGGMIPSFPRIDGTAAALNGSKRSALYAALSATTGPYIVFGRSAIGPNGKGWGDAGSTVAPRLDFTSRSNVNTTWNPITEKWIPNLLTLLTPFRGDKVNVIDFNKRSLPEAYRWKPKYPTENVVGKFLNNSSLTSDFIKFYFTGPSITANDNNTVDDIIVFRATISSLQESYTAGWSPVQMIGRADPNYQYTQFNRDLTLDFTVYATDRDEMKPIYRKLNALAGYMAPEYNKQTIGLTAPWMRITIGDLLVQQPVIVTSLNYGLTDTDTTWEINIEDDPQMMQAPHRVTVSMGITVIGDWLPQKGGTFYSLSKKYDVKGNPISGNNNWLSGFAGSSN